MLKKIGLGLVVIVVLFLGYVSTREGKFNYEASGVINAPAEKVFPYLSDFRKGSAWSPYERMDPNMKKTYSGTDGAVGSMMDFESDEAGSGRLEMLKIVPNELVEIRLTMTKPFKADNLVRYTLAPEGAGTRFTWSMSGDGGFLGKLISTLIDCKVMVIGEFDKGIENLKNVVESGGQ